jgi:hypothetical protein
MSISAAYLLSSVVVVQGDRPVGLRGLAAKCDSPCAVKGDS